MARPWTKSFKQGCLESNNLELLNQLNTKLSELKADEFSWQSNKVLWWTCENGHTWDDYVCNRTGKDTKCPYCTGKRITKGINDLSITHPKLCLDWDYNKNIQGPENYSKGNHTEVYWKCHKCKHEWKHRIDSRTRRGCPGCNKPNGTSFPELVVYYWIKQTFENADNRLKVSNTEYDIYIPELKLAIEYDGYFRHKDKDHLKKLRVAQANKFDLLNIVECKPNDAEPMSRYTAEHTKLKYTLKSDYSNIVEVINSLSIMIESAFGITMEPLNSSIIKDAKEDSQKRSTPQNSMASVYEALLRFWKTSNTIPPGEISKSSSTIVEWQCHKCKATWKKSIHYMSLNFTNCKQCHEKLAPFQGFIEELNLPGGNVVRADIFGRKDTNTSFLEILKATALILQFRDPSKPSLIVNNEDFIRTSKNKAKTKTYLVSDRKDWCKNPRLIAKPDNSTLPDLYIDDKICSLRAVTILKKLIELGGYQKEMYVEL